MMFLPLFKLSLKPALVGTDTQLGQTPSWNGHPVDIPEHPRHTHLPFNWYLSHQHHPWVT